MFKLFFNDLAEGPPSKTSSLSKHNLSQNCEGRKKLLFAKKLFLFKKLKEMKESPPQTFSEVLTDFFKDCPGWDVNRGHFCVFVFLSQLTAEAQWLLMTFGSRL
jgi:hypothetical protein